MPNGDVQGKIEENARNSEQENYKNIQKRRNIANNSENAKRIADAASKSANPYAKAAGAAVKVADKLTGGKASDAIGKRMAKLNSLSPQGRMLQKASNKLAESGTQSRIGKAMSKKNSGSSLFKPAGPLNSTKQNTDDSFLSRREVEDEATDGGDGGIRATAKFLKISMIAAIPVLVLIIFMNLLTSASSVIQFTIGIGNADNTTDAEMEKKITNLDEEKLEQQKDLDAFNYDLFIDDKASKLRNMKLIQIDNKVESKTRLYNEADISELEDYYSQIMNYEEGYDMDMVYTFFYRMHYLYFYYARHYDVYLDIPLLMSTLSVKANDMKDVFKTNTIGYTDEKVNELKSLKYDNERFSYEETFNYKSTPDSGEYDMEILAQHMVSRKKYDSNSVTCEKHDDGYCYYLDYDRYDEFLKEFLEKKYYLGGFDIKSEELSEEIPSSNSCSADGKFVKYNLTDDELRQIASLAYREQGTVKGAAAEASLMANLFELKGKKYGVGAAGLYNYVRNSGWFANSKTFMDRRDASDAVVNAVRSVLVDGKRTLPGYIDEHDFIGDLSSVTTNGKSVPKKNRASYVKFNTKLKNIYGATYTFYSFPDVNSDPFGYSSEKLRQEIGEFYYDFDSGSFVNCESNNSSSNEFADAFVNLASLELENNKGKNGSKYNSFFQYSQNTAWCANFVSYLIMNTTVNGTPMYPNIIDFTSAGAGTFIRKFNTSKKSNVKFYYNDSCSNLKNKNGNKNYTPKKGDLIFFDWDAKYYDISSNTQDHVGIVEKYVDGTIYTIEGNSGKPGRIKRQKYSITDCRVIGFGSWY